MSYSNANFSAFEGEDLLLNFTHSGSDASTASAIVFKMATHAGGTVLLTKDLDDITVLSSTNYKVPIEDTETAALGSRAYYYEVQMTNDDGEKGIVATGGLNLKASLNG